MQNFCIAVGLTNTDSSIIEKVQNFCIVVWFSKFECDWTKCRISALLFGSADLSVIEQSAEFLHRCWFSRFECHSTKCRISASSFSWADLSVIEQGAERRCWVLGSVDLGVFSHWTRCRISAFSIGLIPLRTVILLWLLNWPRKIKTFFTEWVCLLVRILTSTMTTVQAPTNTQVVGRKY